MNIVQCWWDFLENELFNNLNLFFRGEPATYELFDEREDNEIKFLKKC